MRRSRNVLVPVLAALAALTAAPAWASPVLVRDRDGHVHLREDRFLPAADALGGESEPTTARHPLARAAAAKKKPKRTVAAELDRLEAAGQVDPATLDGYRQAYSDAKRTLKKLSGYRRQQLSAVMANLDAIAAAKVLTASRLPSLFLTLQRNRAWWAASPIPRAGQRIAFEGSDLVWQFYPGQGLQIQWLGTFGKANGLWQAKDHDDELRALLDEAIGLGAQRAGGLAFEYLFVFDGGEPPWVSGLSQGTALSALARAGARTGDPKYLDAARSALGIFRTKPPAGIRVATPAGAHYLQYSFARKLHIVNGFVQSLNGLHDFAGIGNDDEARAMFAAGEAELRTELPAFDTGAWSLYSRPGAESDLSYHLLLRDFLRGLCSRLQKQLERAADKPVPYAIPDPALYCETAQHFTDDVKTPPTVKVVPRTLRAKRTGRIRIELSKVSAVAITVRREGKTILSKTIRLGYGKHDLDFKPDKAGDLAVDVRAVDLAGNVGTASGELTVKPPRKHAKKPTGASHD